MLGLAGMDRRLRYQRTLACPLCGAPVLEQEKSFSCSRWRDGCTLTIWKTMAGKRIWPARQRSYAPDDFGLEGIQIEIGPAIQHSTLRCQDGKVSFDFDS